MGNNVVEKESLLGAPPGAQYAQRNPFLLSMRVLFLVGFLALFDLTIIIPTSATYFAKLLYPNIPESQLTVKEDKEANFYFSLSLSFFSIAQAVVGLFGGIMLRTIGFRKTIVFLLCFTIIGDSMYAIGYNYIVAIVGRTLAGVGSANLGMVFTYCAMVTSSNNERNHYMSIARLASTIGLVFSPGMVFLFGFIDFKVIKDYRVYQLNCCGWLVALLAMICIILVVIFVKNPPRRPPPPKPEQESLMLNTAASGQLTAPKKSNSFITKEVVIVFIFSFYNGFTGTSFEFITAPIGRAKYHMNPSTLSLYMLGGSLLSILVILVVMKLSPRWRVVIRIGERFWMMFAFIVFAIGISICYVGSTKYVHIKPSNLGEVAFMVGQTIAMSAYMMLSVSLLPLASKIVPPHAREMMMPWVNSCLAIGRLVGPLWSNFTFTYQDNASTEFMLGSIFGLLVLCTALLLIFWRRMVADAWKIVV